MYLSKIESNAPFTESFEDDAASVACPIVGGFAKCTRTCWFEFLHGVTPFLHLSTVEDSDTRHAIGGSSAPNAVGYETMNTFGSSGNANIVCFEHTEVRFCSMMSPNICTSS